MTAAAGSAGTTCGTLTIRARFGSSVATSAAVSSLIETVPARCRPQGSN
jgi:hypothetical protein